MNFVVELAAATPHYPLGSTTMIIVLCSRVHPPTLSWCQVTNPFDAAQYALLVSLAHGGGVSVNPVGS